MAFAVRSDSASMADINVTPLVDVMLVLLVIFMATAPMLSAGVPVDIPESNAGAIHEDDQGPIEVSLTGTGQIFVGETPVTQDRLIELLGAMTKDNPDRRIFLRADKKLNYGDVMGTLGASGAVLVTSEGAWHASPPPIVPRSTVGAGDSSVAGYVLADCGGEAAPDRLRTAVAYGSAAASKAGSALPKPEDLNTAEVVVTELG